MNLISLLKRKFMPIYLKNSTNINLHTIDYFKTRYFVIANLVRTIKSQMTLCGNFTLTLYSGYILRRDFHLHPISCQRSSLCYAILLHLTFQKHRNHSNCCNFSLMTGKLSQRKWKPILPIFDSVMNSENSKIKSWFRREDLFEFDFELRISDGLAEQRNH